MASPFSPFVSPKIGGDEEHSKQWLKIKKTCWEHETREMSKSIEEKLGYTTGKTLVKVTAWRSDRKKKTKQTEFQYCKLVPFLHIFLPH